MAAAQQASDSPGAGESGRRRWEAPSRRYRLLLRYWSLSHPQDHGWQRWLRVAYIQPIIGGIVALTGAALASLGWLVWHVSIVGVAGVAVAVLGLALAAVSYPISIAYSREYPGKFDERLEEYVARRVSRLSRDEFIPQYGTHDNASNKTIYALNKRVIRALGVEKSRLELSGHTANTPICGVLVVGPEHTNKTGALWAAMEYSLNGWTFVRWPHHMDYPANLAEHLGRRIVLWIDDLHDFARAGEAAALVQFLDQLRKNGQRFLVLASCQDDEQLQEAERFFRPLMNDLQRVLATVELPPTELIGALKAKYVGLVESRKSALRTMEWLQSMRVFTFPEKVIEVLHEYFQDADSGSGANLTWEEVMNGLTEAPPRFVRVDERVEAQAVLHDGRYDFGRWFRNNFFRNHFKKRKKAERPQRVVMPLNVHYLNVEELDQAGSRAEYVQNITSKLEQNPEAIIDVLARHPAATETLILLGDAYLNHLGETVGNAAELALTCYEGALRQLNDEINARQFPGAWAAAYIGKGTAELRLGRFPEADADLREVTDHKIVGEDGRPIPPTLVARAWHGRGDVVAAQIPNDEVTNRLADAADFYKRAADALPRKDALAAETRLDRANLLFEIAALGATKYYEKSLTSTLIQPPVSAIDTARGAFKDAQLDYSYSAAPAVWAEIQRRLGELCLMETLWLLPTELQLPQYRSRMTSAKSNSLVDEKAALATAKMARDYFIAARNVFAPSYLPQNWLQAQVGLVRALLFVARVTAGNAKSQEEVAQTWGIYELALTTANSTDLGNTLLAQSPLEWVDLQLLRAAAEIERAPLDKGGPEGHFRAASSILDVIAAKLNTFEQMAEPARPERIAEQRRDLSALRQVVTKAQTG